MRTFLYFVLLFLAKNLVFKIYFSNFAQVFNISKTFG